MVERTYWLPIKPSSTASAKVFGPYTAAEARLARQTWIDTRFSPITIGIVFQADTKEHAESIAALYMPKSNE